MTTLDLSAPGALYCDARLRRLMAALGAEGDETRIVGGAVRNALIGRPVHEIDLATTALPAVTQARAEAAGLKAVPTGFDHGTVTVVVLGRPFEVTTLREDVETDGRHATVVFGRDFAADAQRRDFTINALSVSPDGKLHDVTGGLVDLAAGRVRFIGDARTRIREDFLRILRFFRFGAEYAAGPLDPDGRDACLRERDGLDRLSRERIGAEMRKLVAAPRAAEILAVMSDAGLLLRLVGGVAEPGRLARTAAAGRGGPSLLAAALVSVFEDGDRLRERLRLSNDEHEVLARYASAVAQLRSSAAVDAAELRRIAATFGVEALLDAAAALAAEPRPRLTSDGEVLLARFRGGLEAAPVFPLAGRDLLARGYSPGPALGRALAQARADWLAAGCPPGWSG